MCILFSAIPTIKNPKSNEPTDRSIRFERYRQKKDLSQMYAPKPASNLTNQHTQSSEQPERPLPGNVESFDSTKSDVTECNVELSTYTSDDPVHALRLETMDLRSRLESTTKELERYRTEMECCRIKNKNLERLNEELKTVHKHQAIQSARTLLAKRFSQNQIDIMLDLKKKPKEWTSEELSMGYSLKYLSRPALDFVIEKLHFPLPSATCLAMHASKINMRKGFFHEVLKILKAWGDTLSQKEKICVLLYDEMSVSEAYEYDRMNDDILNPCSKMQVTHY